MNAMRNRVQLIGRLGQNPEVKEFDKGRKLVRMSIATNTTEIHISYMLMLNGKE